MIIEWRDVVGYEGVYEVSNDGQVRTHEDKTTHTDYHGERHWKQIVLKQIIDKKNSNTCRVILTKNNKRKIWLVHRLVAIAFLPTVSGKDFINHKDGNKLNNGANNLEWCNYTENNNHALDTGLNKMGRKIKVINKQTGETHIFRSMSKASEFVGRSRNYVLNLFKNKKNENKNYIFLEG